MLHHIRTGLAVASLSIAVVWPGIGSAQPDDADAGDVTASSPRVGDEAAAEEATGDASGDHEMAIRACAAAFAKAYNARDPKAIAALFAEDADYVDEEGIPVSGRDIIEEDYTALFADGVERTISITVHSVRLLTSDVAIEDGSFEVTPEPPGPPCDRKYTAVHVKRGGAWQIASIRDMRVPRPSHYEHLKELEWLVGDWVDESPDSLVVTSCRWSDNKNYLVREYAVKIAGMHSRAGEQRIGWDASGNRIRSWTFDTEGGYGEGLWTKEGNRWVIETSGRLPDGTPVSATNIMTRIDNDKITWTSHDRMVGGVHVGDIDTITVVRKPPSPVKSE